MSGVFCLQEFKHIGHLWKSALFFRGEYKQCVNFLEGSLRQRKALFEGLISSLWEDRHRSIKSSVDLSIFSSDKSNFSFKFLHKQFLTSFRTRQHLDRGMNLKTLQSKCTSITLRVIPQISAALYQTWLSLETLRVSHDLKTGVWRAMCNCVVCLANILPWNCGKCNLQAKFIFLFDCGVVYPELFKARWIMQYANKIPYSKWYFPSAGFATVKNVNKRLPLKYFFSKGTRYVIM